MDIDFYEGHTISGADLSFSQYAEGFALTGQTPVVLPLAMRDVTRVRLRAPANGTVYFYEGGIASSGVPTDLTKVHCVLDAGEIQSQKCQTSISATDYWLVTGATGSVLSKTGAWAQFRIEVKPISDTYFFPLTQWFGVSDASGTVQLYGASDPFVWVPANYDVRLVVQANTANTVVAGGLEGYLAKVIG